MNVNNYIHLATSDHTKNYAVTPASLCQIFNITGYTSLPQQTFEFGDQY